MALLVLYLSHIEYWREKNMGKKKIKWVEKKGWGWGWGWGGMSQFSED